MQIIPLIVGGIVIYLVIMIVLHKLFLKFFKLLFFIVSFLFIALLAYTFFKKL